VAVRELGAPIGSEQEGRVDAAAMAASQSKRRTYAQPLAFGGGLNDVSVRLVMTNSSSVGLGREIVDTESPLALAGDAAG
jgi:hypothetical protein